MQEETITLSKLELERVSVMDAILAKRLRQREAADQLGLSIRQIQRLVRRYREFGATGLVSGHRGKTSGNARSWSVRQEMLSLVRERYRDFGPTLASEKLLALHGESISRETLRRWMIADGLWQPRVRRKARIHPRRPCFGELVQIDGSPHDWFEGRAEPCTEDRVH